LTVTCNKTVQASTWNGEILDTGISKSGGAKPVNPFNQQVIG